MGLGIQIQAPIERRGWAKRRPKPATVLDEIEAACRAAIDEPLLAHHARFVREDSSELYVWLHHGTEPLALRVEDEKVVASTNCTPAGPGYHAWLVELLERMGERARLAWDWSPDGKPGDECDYRESRSVERVQHEMLVWLRGLCRKVIERGPPWRGLWLALPIGFHPVRDDVCGPLGVLDEEWIRSVAAAEGSALTDLGAPFFAWWQPTLDARFWRGYGEALCWQRIPWRAPDTTDEISDYEAALAAFRRARELDRSMALPEAAIAELRAYRDGRSEAPSPTGIGYRRGDLQWALPGSWAVRAPGYWYEDHDEDTFCLTFDDRTLQVTVRQFDGAPAEEILAANDDGPGARRWRDGDMHVRTTVEREGGEWHLFGEIVVDGRACLATITYPDEQQRAWAESLVRTIRYRGGRGSIN